MQIAVISGKGGTGKTTIAVGIAEVLKNSTKIDCDVDAANMHLFYKGKKIKEEPFYAGKTAIIDRDKCIECNSCITNCKFNAIDNYIVDNIKCEGCGVCRSICPVGAIRLKDNNIADIIEEKLDNGYLIKADMRIGADGSGKLITALRNRIRDNVDIIIIDGSPGIGCPVIASITNVDLCLIVTEPTLSGLDDLKRMIILTKKLKVKSLVCINKYDINLNVTEDIKEYCQNNGIEIISLTPYDDMVIKSINELKPIVLYEGSKAGLEIKKLADKLLCVYKEECL